MARLAQTRAARVRLAAVTLSLLAHLAIPFVMIRAQSLPPSEAPAPEPIWVALADPPVPPPQPEAAPAGPPDPAPPAASPLPPPKVNPTPPPPDVAPIVVRQAAEPDPIATLGGADLLGARIAGSGGGGGAGGEGSGGAGCDMVERLQAALRRDPEVRAAVARVRHEAGPGRAILVWNGDWVRTPGQDGKGLAGVRQAIALEVAFAPEACRAEPMRGLVLISMADGPGAGRLALGTGAWRWTDLLSR